MDFLLDDDDDEDFDDEDFEADKDLEDDEDAEDDENAEDDDLEDEDLEEEETWQVSLQQPQPLDTSAARAIIRSVSEVRGSIDTRRW